MASNGLTLSASHGLPRPRPRAFCDVICLSQSDSPKYAFHSLRRPPTLASHGLQIRPPILAFYLGLPPWPATSASHLSFPLWTHATSHFRPPTVSTSASDFSLPQPPTLDSRGLPPWTPTASHFGLTWTPTSASQYGPARPPMASHFGLPLRPPTLASHLDLPPPATLRSVRHWGYEE